MFKRILVAAPFAFLLLDISSWFITKVIPDFAYVVIGAGAVVGITFGLQLVISVYQMWLYKPKTTDDM